MGQWEGRALHVVSPSETALSLDCSLQIPAPSSLPLGSPLSVRALSQLPEPSVQGPTLGFWGAGYVWPLSGSRSPLLLKPRARRSSETVAPAPRQANPHPGPSQHHLGRSGEGRGALGGGATTQGRGQLVRIGCSMGICGSDQACMHAWPGYPCLSSFGRRQPLL